VFLRDAWFISDRSHEQGARTLRVLARFVDAFVIGLALLVVWAAFAGQLRTQVYRLPRKAFADAYVAGATGEGGDGMRQAVAGGVGDAVDETTTALALVLLLHLIVPVAYEVICQVLFGRSLGKMVFGLRVVPAGGYRDRPGFVRSLLRACVFMVPVGALYVSLRVSATGDADRANLMAWLFYGVLAGVWLMLLPPRRGLHDLVSGTVVVSSGRLARLRGYGR